MTKRSVEFELGDLGVSEFFSNSSFSSSQPFSLDYKVFTWFQVAKRYFYLRFAFFGETRATLHF